MRSTSLAAVSAIAMLVPLVVRAQDRPVAEWVVRLGGAVTPVGSQEPIRDVEKLPQGEFRLIAVDLTGTLVTPEELSRLAGLIELRELYFPAPMWNEGSSSRRDSNDAFRHLAGLKNLETLHVSIHFLTSVHIQD